MSDLNLPSADQLTALLACPRCRRGPVAPASGGWICGACSSGYPVIGEIPWLFPEPRQALAEWRARFGMLRQYLGSEAAAMHEAAAQDVGKATRRRLEQVAAAYEDQVRLLAELLAPLGLEQSAMHEATHRGVGTKLPLEQGLTNYYVNVHRDWSWGAAENAAAVGEVAVVLGGELRGLGHTLVLGAGAGRLAFDLHQGGDAPLTVATDFNPLLLFVAREMFAGRSLELYEFAIAPRNLEDHAPLRRLASPAATRTGLELLAADALQAPFADGVFDTVVTPWFIDIIGEPFARVAARVNLLLRPGGRWINTGSMAFSRAAHADRIGLEEALEMLPGAGFGDVSVRENTLPYMRSPASRHSRLESVVTWVARKSATVTEAPRARVVPEWLLQPDRAVPRTRAFEMQAISSRVHAFLLAMINGERSARDMARMLVDQRLMTADEAESQVILFLTRLHEESETQ
ncbi:MAG TPA: methyltransferase domain-containing protein [Steroidobacteraceae bacterium]|nr:methyltransferase domain-containing protein [Steroidobacteraceae bacterium]